MASVELTPQAQKDLRKLDGMAKKKALQALAQLKNDPFAGHTLTQNLAGARSLEFSAPGGAFRAIYVITADNEVCVVFIVGAHESIYEEAARRYTRYKRIQRDKPKK